MKFLYIIFVLFLIFGAFITFASIYLDFKILKRRQEKKILTDFFKHKQKNERIKGVASGFSKAESLYTEAEKKFLKTLESLNSQKYKINGKTRLADIAIAPAKNGNTDISRFRRVSQKHVDFVLIDKATNEPVLVIELDDASHQHPDRIARDKLVDAILKECGIPILHYPCQSDYDPRIIKQKILGKLTPQKPLPWEKNNPALTRDEF